MFDSKEKSKLYDLILSFDTVNLKLAYSIIKSRKPSESMLTLVFLIFTQTKDSSIKKSARYYLKKNVDQKNFIHLNKINEILSKTYEDIKKCINPLVFKLIKNDLLDSSLLFRFIINKLIDLSEKEKIKYPDKKSGTDVIIRGCSDSEAGFYVKYVPHSQKKQIFSKFENYSYKVDMTGNDLKTIPDSIKYINFEWDGHPSKEFNASNNALKKYPSVLHKMNFKIIRLNDNQIKKIPAAISKNKFLKELYMMHNQLKAIPDKLFEIPLLKKLNLSFNNITSVPESVIKLKKGLYYPGRGWESGSYFQVGLQVLVLKSNLIDQLPDVIDQLTALRILDLRANDLTELPESLCRCNSLQSLYLKDNPLHLISSRIFCLPKLKNLNFSLFIKAQKYTVENKVMKPLLKKWIKESFSPEERIAELSKKLPPLFRPLISLN
jgi:Leucine-rich repeat (LRR) protein